MLPHAWHTTPAAFSNRPRLRASRIQRLVIELSFFFLAKRVKKFLIKNYQEYLINLDLNYSKAKYSLEINGIMPNISENEEIELFKAYHPLLYRSNKLEGERTYPQNITLNNKNRIIVISGPNAGGKSITLKTVGLIQIMVQTGILIPVNEKSKICFFKRILTDIGDNQSIENHLSTYSYRLKNMKIFLNKCDEKTLFLIDEFGTGSDPELGGALAEVILEEFYKPFNEKLEELLHMNLCLT